MNSKIDCAFCQLEIQPNKNCYVSRYNEDKIICEPCAMAEADWHENHFCDYCKDVQYDIVFDKYGSRICKDCYKNKTTTKQETCNYCGGFENNLMTNASGKKICETCKEKKIKKTGNDSCHRCGANNLTMVDYNNQKICKECGSELEMKISRDDIEMMHKVQYGLNDIYKDILNGDFNPEIAKVLMERVHEQERGNRTKSEEELKKLKTQKEEQERKRKEEERSAKQKKLEEKRERFLQSISSIVGMQNIKTTLTNWIQRQDAIALLKDNTDIQIANASKNIIITGNSGVGKTMLARKLTSILYEAGFIAEKKFTEVKAEDIVGKHVGATAQNTKQKIQEAGKGVFFLDEAYRLTGGNFGNDTVHFGLEALETIMGYMDNPNDKKVFIFAGYEDKMQEFLEANPGLRSRVQEPFRLLDYTLEELTQIGMNVLQERKYNTSQIESVFSDYIHKNMQQGILVGNGRTVIHYVNQIIEQHLLRIVNQPETEDYTMLLPEDVKNVFEKNFTEQEGLKNIFLEAKEEIHELIGMESLKKEIEKLGNFQYIQNKRRQAGLKVEKKSHHMTFLGDAGTGKTTIARLIGKMFRGAGVLTNGHFVEATKDMLTTGESIPKTVKSIVEKAKGGILFIDEAYSLANDGKGKEALDALIPLMENNRDDFICVLAGYEEDMKKLFQLNQGLISRIPNHFHFENYNADELIQMMHVKLQKEEYHLEEGADKTLSEAIHMSVEQNIVNGNGRWVRNFFEQILMTQNERLFQEECNGKELHAIDFATITSEDISEAMSTLPNISSEEDTDEKDIKNMIKKLKKLEKINN